MIRILFVCQGNICRSQMAEFMFKKIVYEKGLSNSFYIDSASTSNEETGSTMYYKAVNKLLSENVPFEEKKSKRMNKLDYLKYDYIIGMDKENVKDILNIVGEDYDKKICRLLDFSSDKRDIKDPWYTNDFDKAYEDILKGLYSLLKYFNIN